jgi:hypothetical protein
MFPHRTTEPGALEGGFGGRTRGRAHLQAARAFAPALLLSVLTSASATDRVAGERRTFESPNGITETCVALARIPGGVYSDGDRTQEAALCGIDIYDPRVAICPKLRSTSPGTFVYEITRGPFAGDQKGFEAHVCPRGEVVVSEADGPPASFKVTMNAKGTSGTFSTASLLYYHFSRYLDSSIHVPVSVYRSIDRRAHERRVTTRGLALSAGKKPLRMNHAAWQELDAVEKDPEGYPEPDELFTADRSRIYGVLLHVKGKRYGAGMNGTRKSGWGVGQNRDFQETAPYLALRTGKPLQEAIAEGLTRAGRDPALKKAMRGGVSEEQMAHWMQDLTEITLLDYIFSQQDRVGKIDRVAYWHWTERGELKRAEARSETPPEEIAEHEPRLIQRTWLNDNDAGGKRKYANFAKKTGMLEKIRHYNPNTYRRLMALVADFEAQGELYAYLRDTFGLTDAQLRQAIANTRKAADILRGTCRAGKLRFDLAPDEFFVTGKAAEHDIDCENP